MLPTRQPLGLPASETDRRRRYSITMQQRWKHARSTARPNAFPSRTGAGRQGNIFSFRSREKNVLDMPSYRSGVSTRLRRLFVLSSVTNEFLVVEAAQTTLRSLPESHSEYLHPWFTSEDFTSEDFARQRLRPIASGCASNPIAQKEGRQASRSVRKR